MQTISTATKMHDEQNFDFEIWSAFILTGLARCIPRSVSSPQHERAWHLVSNWHVVCIPDSLSMLFGVKLSSSPSVSELRPSTCASNVFAFIKHRFLLQCNMVDISSGFTNGLTTRGKPKRRPVELLSERSHFSRRFAPGPIELASLWNTRWIWNRCIFAPHSPFHIPTSLCFPIAEAIWSHPGVTVAPRGAVILAKWRSGLTTYNHSHFHYRTKRSDFILIYPDVLLVVFWYRDKEPESWQSGDIFTFQR